MKNKAAKKTKVSVPVPKKPAKTVKKEAPAKETPAKAAKPVKEKAPAKTAKVTKNKLTGKCAECELGEYCAGGAKKS